MSDLAQQIARYLASDPHAREVSIQQQADGNYEVTLTDLNRDRDVETPRCIGATPDKAMDRALDADDKQRERRTVRVFWLGFGSKQSSRQLTATDRSYTRGPA